MSHTTGNWTTSDQTAFSTHNHPERYWERAVTTDAGHLVAKACGATEQECNANAILLASPVDLLAALEAVMKEYLAICDNICDDDDIAAIEKATDAIAKATSKKHAHQFLRTTKGDEKLPMSSQQRATMLARAVNGEAWNSGGNIWLVRVQRHDGSLVVFSDEEVSDYINQNAFENGMPDETITL